MVNITMCRLFCCDRWTQYFKAKKQECIPVGCVPSAAVAVCWGCLRRGCLPRGFLPRGVCPRRGVCLGVWGSAQGGGGLQKGGVYPSMHWSRHPPCEQNDRQVWKLYLAATSLRTVRRGSLVHYFFPPNIVSITISCYVRNEKLIG